MITKYHPYRGSLASKSGSGAEDKVAAVFERILPGIVLYSYKEWLEALEQLPFIVIQNDKQV